MINTFKTLDRAEAHDKMEEWITSGGTALPVLSSDYQKIRDDLTSLFEQAVSEMNGKRIDQYEFDVRFGLYVYSYLNTAPWFNMMVASDEGFWRYLTIVVSPDLTSKRWGFANVAHFWEKNTRIWFYTLWWYIHLGWQNDIASTRARLLDSRFSTDTIMHFVERTSRKGMNIGLYRAFFDVYCNLPAKTITFLRAQNKNLHSGGVLGSLLCLNTARIVVMEPAFFEGGMTGYAQDLFLSIGADKNTFEK